MVSLLGNPNVPEACCLIFSKFSILLLWIFSGLLSHTLCSHSCSQSNRNPFIPCSLVILSHYLNDWRFWQGPQQSLLPLAQGTFYVPSI